LVTVIHLQRKYWNVVKWRQISGDPKHGAAESKLKLNHHG
jgi:hypothetical protein